MADKKEGKTADVPMAQLVLTAEELQEIREQVKRQLKDRQQMAGGPIVSPVSYTR